MRGRLAATALAVLCGCTCELPEDGRFPAGSYGGGDGELLTIAGDGTGELQLGCTWWQIEDELRIVEGVFETTVTTEDYELPLTGTMCGDQVDAVIDGRQLVLILDQEVIQPPCDPGA